MPTMTGTDDRAPDASKSRPTLLVGSLMARALTRLPWDDVAQALPAFLAAIMIPLTYSIADGIAIGFISYPIVMLLAGRGREVRFLTYVLGLVFILRYSLKWLIALVQYLLLYL